jgi:hypothetical protein
MAITAPFLLVSAFASTPDSGNPAAVVFLPSPGCAYPDAQLQGIAKNLNQPITTFISPLPEREGGAADFFVRWFTVELETQFCGHGTVAAAKAIYATPDLAAKLKLGSGVTRGGEADGDAAAHVGVGEVLKFLTMSGVIVSAGKVTAAPDTHSSTSPTELIQAALPQAPPVPIDPTSPAAEKVRAALRKALKGEGDVEIAYMGHGVGAFDCYLVVELGGAETLDRREVMTHAFVR